ncbi:MAG: fatty acyl-AMP ligase [Desulfobacterales bacterium]|nr:fatty acyl-AMP ligase [Desulfobacterales bacterium]
MINMTIVDFLKDRATRNADDLAFRFMGNGEIDGPMTEWTFAELFHQSAGVAEDLVEQGLSGSSVLLVFPPGLDFVKAFYGCLLAGARAVPVPLPNPKSKNPFGRIFKTAAVSGGTTVLTTQQLADMVPEGSDMPVTLRAVTDRVVTDWNGPKAEMDEVAYLQFTSGSTGHPKGVAVTHAHAIANLRVMGQMLRIKPSKPGIVWAPHYHDLCLVGHVLGPVHFGFESTLMSPLEFLMKPVRWLRAMSHYKIANTACPNFGYEYAARRIKPEDCEGLDLSHWEVAGNGGEPVLPQTMEVFNKKFGPFGFRPQAFMPTYGMAESVLFVAGLKSETKPPKLLTLSSTDLETHKISLLDENDPDGRIVVSCGSPGSDHKIIAVDPETFTQCNPNQVGELWLKGPSVPGVYWGMPEQSEATFGGRLSDTEEGPFLRTGDLGFVADGEIYVTGRLKDLIIIAGRNHYPSDIELSVQRSGAPVRLGSCVAISERINGAEELIIVAEVDDRKLPADAKNGASESLDEFWASAVKTVQGAVTKGHSLSVRSVVFVEPRSLEKTSSGKPRRSYYQSLYLKGDLAMLHETKAPQAA